MGSEVQLAVAAVAGREEGAQVHLLLLEQWRPRGHHPCRLCFHAHVGEHAAHSTAFVQKFRAFPFPSSLEKTSILYVGLALLVGLPTT